MSEIHIVDGAKTLCGKPSYKVGGVKKANPLVSCKSCIDIYKKRKGIQDDTKEGTK